MCYILGTMHAIPLTDDLLRKAKLLKESQLFADPSGEGTTYEKQALFLVLAGEKPVGEASSGHWEATGNGRTTVADDPHAVGDFLASLGLAYHLSSFDGHATDALVAADERLLAQYHQADVAYDIAEVGRLFGYPETAVAAFAADSEDLLLDYEEIDRQAAAGGIDPLQVSFRLSKAHWADELAVVHRWQTLLIAAGLAKPYSEPSTVA